MTASRCPCSLAATSNCGDLLVATLGNSLRYSFYPYKKLWPVRLPNELADSLKKAVLFTVRFDLMAGVALLAGRHFLSAASRLQYLVSSALLLGDPDSAWEEWGAMSFGGMAYVNTY